MVVISLFGSTMLFRQLALRFFAQPGPPPIIVDPTSVAPQIVPEIMTAVASSNSFVELCGKIAPAAAVVVFTAPIPTIAKIIREKNVGQMPLLPYSSMIASAAVWTAYGLLKSNAKIWSPNGIGLILSLYYFSQFIRFCPPKAPSLPGSVKQHMQGVSAILLATLAVAATMKDGARWIGLAGVALCIFMFAAPLTALQTVIAQKSAKSIPLPFALMSAINCFCWTVSGWFDMKDVNVYVPNAMGLTFSIAQIVLKIVYGNRKPLKPVDLPI